MSEGIAVETLATTIEDADQAIDAAHKAINRALGMSLTAIAQAVHARLPDVHAICITTTYSDGLEDYKFDSVIELDIGEAAPPLPEPFDPFTKDYDLEEEDPELDTLLGDLTFLMSPLGNDFIYIVPTDAPIYFHTNEQYDSYRRG